MQSSNAQPQPDCQDTMDRRNSRGVLSRKLRAQLAMRSHQTLMEVGRDSRLAPSGSANIEAKTHDLPQEYELAFAEEVSK